MKKLLFVLPLLASCTLLNLNVMAQPANGGATVKPPVAKKVPKTTTIHGETLVDDYFWLREKTNKEVIDYLEAENSNSR